MSFRGGRGGARGGSRFQPQGPPDRVLGTNKQLILANLTCISFFFLILIQRASIVKLVQVNI